MRAPSLVRDRPARLALLSLVIHLGVLGAPTPASTDGDEANPDAALPSPTELPPRNLARREWTIEDGLPQSTVTSIAQTSDGYLWLGTFGGLVRFDGVQFETFSMANTEAFRANRVLRIHADPRGGLWIGMQSSGLLQLEDGRFRRVGTVDGVEPGMIRDIECGSAGETWIAARSLYQVRAGVLHPIPGLPPYPQHLGVDRTGDLWIGYSHEVWRWNSKESESFAFESGAVSALEVSPAGEPLVALDDGRLLAYDGRTWETRVRLESSFITELEVDSSGRLKVLTSEGFQISSPPDSPHSSPDFEAAPEVNGSFRSLFTDRENNTWLGTEARGLVQLRELPIPHLPLGSIHSPILANAGELWFVCDERVGHLEDNRFQELVEFPRSWGLITSLAPDGHAGLWIGVRDLGLVHYDGEKLTEFGAEAGLASVNSLLRARDGTLWIGMESEVGTFEDSRFHPVATAKAEVTVLSECKSGSIYVGTIEGIAEIHGTHLEQLPTPPEYPDVPVRAIYEDPEGTVWVGTYGLGLIRIRDSVATRISSESGLADDSILALVPDDQGYLWMNSNRGPFRVLTSELDAFATGAVNSISSDFFSGVEGNGSSAGRLDKQGRIWFATVTGLSVIDPATVETNHVPPGVAINHVIANGRKLLASDPEVPPGAGDLEIRYSGLSYSDPTAVRFRFILEGHQEHWYNAGVNRTASFAKVPPGDYVFRVQASNNSGVWNKVGAAFPLTIQPAYYQTHWFLGLSVAGVLGLALLAHLYRLRAVDHQNRVLESKIAERTSELALVNDELKSFTYTVSHDLRAPLRHIRYFAERIREKLDLAQTPEVQNELERIVESSEHMGSLIEDLLNLSKLGRRPLHRQEIDTQQLVQELWNRITTSEPERVVEFQLGPLPHVHADLDLLKHVFTNLLENAFKYTRTRAIGRVAVSSFRRDGHAWFRILDNGVGFEQAYESSLFSPFERLHSQAEFEGSGIGLAIAHRMIQKHGGEIVGRGTLGVGAEFEFTLEPDVVPV